MISTRLGVVQWSALVSLAPVAELFGSSIVDLESEMAGMPEGVSGIALVDGVRVTAVGLLVELELHGTGKLALARVCGSPRAGVGASLALVEWFEEEAQRRGARTVEVSLRHAEGAQSVLEASGYRPVDATLRMRRSSIRAVGPLSSGLEERDLGESGLATWVQIVDEAFRNVPFSAPMTMQDVERLCADPQFDAGLIRVVFDPLGAIGALYGAVSEHGVGEVVSLGVLPRARRSGLGRWLLRRCEALLDQRGVTEVILRVSESNAPALELYRREGYQVVLRNEVLTRSL